MYTEFKVIGYHAITHEPTEYHNIGTQSIGQFTAEGIAKELGKLGIDGEIHGFNHVLGWVKIKEWHWNE